VDAAGGDVVRRNRGLNALKVITVQLRDEATELAVLHAFWHAELF
jgi:hypothetical protein